MAEQVLIYEPDSPTELRFYGEQIAASFPELGCHLASTHAEALAAASGSTILIAKSTFVTPELVAAMPRLKWVQSLISGVDPLRKAGLPADVLVSAARGIHGPQMAELAILHMLALNRRLPEILRNQARETWSAWPQPLLLYKTVLIVGVGAIAETVAARCSQFGMRVLGVSSRPSAPGFEKLYPRAQLREAAALADFVVLLIPLDESSRGLIDRAVLAAMKPTAFLVNIARGGVLDEAALIEALNERWIAGAAIDVASVEPLPAGHSLWRAPNLIVTPHLGGRSDIYHQQVAPLLVRNIGLFLEGRADQIPFTVALG